MDPISAELDRVKAQKGGHQRDVWHHPGKPLALCRLEVRKHCDPADLLPLSLCKRP
jgi:hypothetical protein